jgi:hypothetical protein
LFKAYYPKTILEGGKYGIGFLKNQTAKVVSFPLKHAQNIIENEFERKYQIVKRD